MLTDKRQAADGIAGPLIVAFENAWAQIRYAHPEVPPAVLTTGSGSDSRHNVLRLGHFAASRWQTGAEGDVIDEIFVGGEGLERGAREVLATLLHEAAHALARVRGIQDTSRQGRYHNSRFKVLAEELGLKIDKHPVIDWSTTTLPTETAKRYARTIEQLEHAITIYRRHEGGGGAEKTRKPGPPPCVCDCGRRIRVAPAVLAIARSCAVPASSHSLLRAPTRTAGERTRADDRPHLPSRPYWPVDRRRERGLRWPARCAAGSQLPPGPHTNPRGTLEPVACRR